LQFKYAIAMSNPVISIAVDKLLALGLRVSDSIHYQLSPRELIENCLCKKEGILNDSGALVIHTGAFTGRSPKDRYIVKDETTAHCIHWNEFNQAIDEKHYHNIFKRMTDYLNAVPEIWIRDCYACAETQYRLNIRIITETPSMNLFAYNMFLRPEEEELEEFKADWHILAAPHLKLNAEQCGTRQQNAVVISFKQKMVLLAGTGYTGEIKKAIFSVLNYILPAREKVLSMHCAANMGEDGDTALFFGLSGTGKTTLSTDSRRKLIGDDEHGWNGAGVFNFEGGCYAKCIHLNPETEPEIFQAIHSGALVENVQFFKNTNRINFEDGSITENTRVSYPLNYITNAQTPSIGNIPENIFFLTCDAYGILPPIEKLNPGQAMYHFISGYTAKVAGTETGITEPKSTFSACFGAPFMPLHPAKYAAMLGQKIKDHKVRVWLINTGWSGGPYGVGTRIKLCYTRAMINAAIENKLDRVDYEIHPVFGIAIPASCPNVPTELLNPRNTWADKQLYDEKARHLAKQFIENFRKYETAVPEEILAAAPKF